MKKEENHFNTRMILITISFTLII